MKIAQINIYQYDTPIKGKPYRMSNTVMHHFDSTIVEIITDKQITGYGETCPVGPVYQPQHAMGARAALKEMGPHLIGQNPLAFRNVYRAMDHCLNGHNYAKAAVDMALWDICGKFYGARVCDLLGGAVRETIPSYYSIGVCPVDEAVDIAKEKQKEGYPRLQLKVGGRSLEEDIAVIRKVSEILEPGIRLAADANRSWTTRDAVLLSSACRKTAFVMEQPCNTYEENMSLKGRVCHPIYLDENTENLGIVLKAVSDHLADGFGFKVTRLGGISAMLTVREVCREMKKPMTCDDAWGGDIVAAACVHLGATVEPGLFEGAWLAAPYNAKNYDPENGINIVNGHIEVPKGPGLGILPDTTMWGKPVMAFN
ncbi:MAG: mandelate racemase/muconate lactonizing enzyme family protein [Desulfotignum sp.]|nr:mandelate racemase/muconate lactonizing enzyme family protein [Desulfotignum sp.]MCF8136003.1 mandelate racemase/muconate lactonizing enzyme family protein [Desulfotignum sp.]